jgi:hypothetical protein
MQGTQVTAARTAGVRWCKEANCVQSESIAACRKQQLASYVPGRDTPAALQRQKLQPGALTWQHRASCRSPRLLPLLLMAVLLLRLLLLLLGLAPAAHARTTQQ